MLTVLLSIRLPTSHLRMTTRQFSVYCIRGSVRLRRGLAIRPGCPSDGLVVNAPPVRAIVTYFGIPRRGFPLYSARVRLRTPG